MVWKQACDHLPARRATNRESARARRPLTALDAMSIRMVTAAESFDATTTTQQCRQPYYYDFLFFQRAQFLIDFFSNDVDDKKKKKTIDIIYLFFFAQPPPPSLSFAVSLLRS